MTVQHNEREDDSDGRGAWGLHHIHTCWSHNIPNEQLQKETERGKGKCMGQQQFLVIYICA